MKICIVARGDINSHKFWSGTPSTLMKYFQKKNDIEISELTWNYWKPFFSFYCVVFSKLFFTWGSDQDPYLRLFVERRLRRKLKHIKDIPDLFFCLPGVCLPNSSVMINKSVNYIDAILYDLLPYMKKKWAFKWFMHGYEKNLLHDYMNLSILFTQNEWSKQSIIKKYSISTDKVHNVGFGVNLIPYTGEKDYSSELLLIVLRKGTEQYKGLFLLLAAFKILKKSRPLIRLAVVGTELKEKIEGVTYYYNQPRERTEELFKQCTLYTMPAIHEPNGITYLEALANKAPIMGLNRFAVPEFSGYGEWGFMAKNEDPNEIAIVIDDALSDKNRLKEMGIKGQQFVMERYRWEIVVEKMLTEMKKVI